MPYSARLQYYLSLRKLGFSHLQAFKIVQLCNR